MIESIAVILFRVALLVAGYIAFGPILGLEGVDLYGAGVLVQLLGEFVSYVFRAINDDWDDLDDSPKNKPADKSGRKSAG